LRTLGSPFFALQVAGEDGAVAGNSGSQILDLLANTSTISKVVLVILALFSVPAVAQGAEAAPFAANTVEELAKKLAKEAFAPPEP